VDQEVESYASHTVETVVPKTAEAGMLQAVGPGQNEVGSKKFMTP